MHFDLQNTNLLSVYEALVAADLSDGTLDNEKQPFEAMLTGQTTGGITFKGSDTLGLFVAGNFGNNDSQDQVTDTIDEPFFEIAPVEPGLTDRRLDRTRSHVTVSLGRAPLQARGGLTSRRGGRRTPRHRTSDVSSTGPPRSPNTRPDRRLDRDKKSVETGSDAFDIQPNSQDPEKVEKRDGDGRNAQPKRVLKVIDDFFSELGEEMAALDIF